MFALTDHQTMQPPNGFGHPISSDEAADDRIEALLAELERIEIRPVSRLRADRTLGLLSRMQAVAASKMCDVARRVSEADCETDPSEVLRSKARLSRRESPKAKQRRPKGVPVSKALRSAPVRVLIMIRRLRIGHATIKLTRGTLALYTPAEALSSSWIPGNDNTRYGRQWRISRHHVVAEGVWGGKIGFIRQNVTDYWDSKNNDFQDIPVEVGTAVPFIINVPQQLLSFQFAPGRSIQIYTVTTNLRALLNKPGPHTWEIDPLPTEQTYEAWRATVDGITKVRATLQRPNPTYLQTANIESMIEDFEADVVTMEAKGNPINENSEWLEEAENHVGAGNGGIRYQGRDTRTGLLSEYRSDAAHKTDTIASDQSDVAFEGLLEVQNDVIQEGKDEHGEEEH